MGSRDGILAARASGPHGVGGEQPYASHLDESTGEVYFLPVATEAGTPGLFAFKGKWLALDGDTEGFTDCEGDFGQRVVSDLLVLEEVWVTDNGVRRLIGRGRTRAVRRRSYTSRPSLLRPHKMRIERYEPLNAMTNTDKSTIHHVLLLHQDTLRFHLIDLRAQRLVAV